MFDLLKKKLGTFKDSLVGKIKEKDRETPPKDAPPQIEEAKLPQVEEVREEVVEGSAEAGKKPKEIEVVKEEVKGREIRGKLSAGKKITSFLRGSVRLEEKDLEQFLDELELALIESDVEQNTAEEIVKKLKGDLAGREISGKEDVSKYVGKEIRKVLGEIMETEKVDFMELVSGKKPFVVLFLGPNGAGKTTTMAKLTKKLQDNGKKVVWAAGDTFRAASIEQLEKHGEKLGVRIVKHNYGADPAAVAFDAVESAKAKGIDVVMIDSAGRQVTNKNLMEELKKINRVAKPDLKLFVGEALAGVSLLEQARAFHENLGIDGFILTKIDTDTKGGTMISLLYNIKKPVLYLGTGQGYGDIMDFTPNYVLDRIVA